MLLNSNLFPLLKKTTGVKGLQQNSVEWASRVAGRR